MVAVTNKQFRYNVNVQEGGAAESGVLIYGFNQQDQVIINKTTDAQGDVTVTNIETQQRDDDGVSPVVTTRTPVRIRALKFGFFYEEQSPVIQVGAASLFDLQANTVLTESVQATIDAYTGITYDDVTDDSITLDNTGITPVNNVERLYDFTHSRYSKAATPPQTGFFEIIGSTDKQNYIYDYDIILNASGFEFDGQNRSFVRGNINATPVTLSGARFKDISLDFLILSTGSSGLTTNNVNVSDTLFFGENGTYTWNGGSLNNVDLSGGATAVTLNLTNGASVTGTVDPGITLVQSVPVFIKCVDESGANIPGVNILLGTGPGLGDVVNNVLTDSNGEVNETYAGTTPDTAEGFAAKGTEVPTFVRAPLGGPINAGTGYSQTITLISDD